MIKLSTTRHVTRRLLKGLLLIPFLFNSLHALELKTLESGASNWASNSSVEGDSRPEITPRVLECPQGFNQSGILNVCVAENLSLNVVTGLLTDNRCQRDFEKLIGTSFCTQKNHFLSADKDFYFITGENTGYCPENYSRPPGSDICVEQQLSLIELGGELKLIAPNGGTGVPPDEAVGLFAPPPIQCEPGFIKPPGFYFCIANELANTAEPDQHEFEIPVGSCPDNWSRKVERGFCLPENYLHVCGVDFSCKAETGDSLRILPEPVDCPEGFLYLQTNIPTNSQSTQDSSALIPVYACVPPDKF